MESTAEVTKATSAIETHCATYGIEMTIRQKIGDLEPGEIRVICGWSVWSLRNHSPAMYQLCRRVNGQATNHLFRLEQAVEFLLRAA